MYKYITLKVYNKKVDYAFKYLKCHNNLLLLCVYKIYIQRINYIKMHVLKKVLLIMFKRNLCSS